MNDSAFMRGRQRRGNLAGNWQHLVDRDRPLLNPVSERGTVHQFKDEGGHRRPSGSEEVLESVDLRDIGMIQGRQQLRLAIESRQLFRIGREGPRQYLYGDVPIEPGVPRTVDLTHATNAKRRADLVDAEARSNGQMQEVKGRVPCSGVKPGKNTRLETIVRPLLLR